MKELFFDQNPAVLKGKFLSFLPNVLEAIVALIAFYVLYRIVSFILKRILRRSGMQETLISIINTIFKILLAVFAVIMIAKQFGVNITSSLAGVGVVGIAIGFAAQDALSNIISGFMIFFDKPFKVGDYITYAGEYGRIEKITIRSTRIRTQDNTFVVIPNQKIINDVVIDHSTRGDTRVVISVEIAYRESIEHARQVILDKVALIEGVLTKPAPDVVVDELGSSGVKLRVRVWIKNASIERRIHFATTETVKNALDEAGIEIPFPQMQIHYDKT